MQLFPHFYQRPVNTKRMEQKSNFMLALIITEKMTGKNEQKNDRKKMKNSLRKEEMRMRGMIEEAIVIAAEAKQVT